MKKTILAVIAFVMLSVNCSKNVYHLAHMKNQDFVPDEKTAIKIAEAIWLPIYGEEINDERPFKAILSNGVWTVYGTLPFGYLGGVASVEIRKSDCKILGVGHTK